MLSSLLARIAALRLPAASAFRRPRWHRASASAVARRLGHFWLVWSALLLVHEAGHALSAWRQGLTVRRITVGAGPVLWRGQHDDTRVVLRLVPLAGVTTMSDPRAAAVGSDDADRWRLWGQQLATLGGGVLATLALALGIAGAVAVRERITSARWVWGRLIVGDALVLTVFNFLPVPPLDGGRAVLGALAVWRGAPLSGDALFWVQVGGLALAIVPMTLWTRWTARIDAAALWWGAPAPAR